MLIKYRRDAVLRGVGSAQLLAFFNGVGKARTYASPDDGQFQFGKHRTHLYKGLAHRVYVSVPAIYGDASEDFQTQMLGLDDVDDFA